MQLTNYDNIMETTNQKVEFPDDIFANKQEHILADSLILLYKKCGSSYYHRVNSGRKMNHCNDEIADGFNRLRLSFIHHQPFTYIFRPTYLNLKKRILVENERYLPDFLSFSSLLLH